MRASASNNAVARSPASRTTGLKAMRCSALACSLTMLIRLPHIISRSMPSMSALCLKLPRCNETAIRVHLHAPIAQHEDGGFPFLDDHRSIEPLIAGQRGTFVNRDHQRLILEVHI